MNKIYKVIWSKTRNCYVAVAEFVKRNGKGGSVMNRRHIAAALKKLQHAAVSCDGVRLATPLTCRHVAAALAAVAIFAAPVSGWANSGGELKNYPDVPFNSTYVGSRNSGNDVSVERHYENGVIIQVVIGGYADSNATEGNAVTIASDLTLIEVYGGYSGSGSAKSNTVTVNVGTIKWEVYGGYSESGSVENNKVIISGGEINGNVYGGRSAGGDVAVEKNRVILSKEKNGSAPVLKGTLYGGFNSGNNDNVANNTLQVEAAGLSAPVIQNFENYEFVLPSDMKADDIMLSLSAQDANLAIDGSKVDVSMTGGTVADIGLKLDESVTLLHKTGGGGAFTVNNSNGAVYTKPLDDAPGGLPEDVYSLTATENKLNVTVSELYLYGDGGTNTPGQREKDNALTISEGDRATAAFGGRAATGDVTGNTATMKGGELVYDISYADIQGCLYGGLTDKGNAKNNTATLSGGKVKERVYGGTTYDGNTENNTVRIRGGAVGTQVYGGRTYGGGNAVNNTVTIEGGTVGERVYGGRSANGNVVNNTVTLSGGMVGGMVYGGYATDGAAMGNAVNLTGTTTGLDSAKLRGYNNSATSHSGNELHVGGTKTYDQNGNATITKGSWQGMDAGGTHTNKVNTVANFDSIALHNVVWGSTPALSAKNMENIGGLDVTGLEFFTPPGQQHGTRARPYGLHGAGAFG